MLLRQRTIEAPVLYVGSIIDTLGFSIASFHPMDSQSVQNRSNGNIIDINYISDNIKIMICKYRMCSLGTDELKLCNYHKPPNMQISIEAQGCFHSYSYGLNAY